MPRIHATLTSPALLRIALGLAFSAALSAGCQPGMKDSSAAPAPSPGQPPATLPNKFQPPTTAPMSALPHAAPAPAPAAEVKAPAMADMTHMLSKDEPYFTGMPSGSDAPAGTLKAGTKTLLLVPGAKYSKVMTDSGMTAYTMTDGLEPISKK